MTDGEFRRQIDRWILREDPSENPDYLRERDAHEAWQEYYTPRVVTDFTKMHYKPGDTVKWTEPDDKRSEGVVIGATVTDAIGYPVYIVLQGKEVIQVDEMILAYGWTDPEPEYSGTTASGQPLHESEIPF